MSSQYPFSRSIRRFETCHDRLCSYNLVLITISSKDNFDMPNKPKLRCSPYHKHAMPFYVYIADTQRANLIRSSDWSDEKPCPEVSWALEWDISVDEGSSTSPAWGVWQGEICGIMPWRIQKSQTKPCDFEILCASELCVGPLGLYGRNTITMNFGAVPDLLCWRSENRWSSRETLLSKALSRPSPDQSQGHGSRLGQFLAKHILWSVMWKFVLPKSGPLDQLWLPKMVPPNHFWLPKMVPSCQN